MPTPSASSKPGLGQQPLSVPILCLRIIPGALTGLCLLPHQASLDPYAISTGNSQQLGKAGAATELERACRDACRGSMIFRHRIGPPLWSTPMTTQPKPRFSNRRTTKTKASVSGGPDLPFSLTGGQFGGVFRKKSSISLKYID
jgi:hypothetical protein